MSWLALQIGASILAALNSILDKHLTDCMKIHPLLYLLSFGVISLPVVLLGAVGIVPWPPLADLALVLASGLCFAIAVNLYYRAIALEEVSRLVPLLRLSPVFVLLLSILFFGERLQIFQYLAFVTMLTGSSLLVLKPGERKNRLSKGVFLMLIVAALLAINSTLTAQLYREYSLATAFIAGQAGVAFGVATVLLFAPGKRQLIQQTRKLSLLVLSIVVGEQAVRLSSTK